MWYPSTTINCCFRLIELDGMSNVEFWSSYIGHANLCSKSGLLHGPVYGLQRIQSVVLTGFGLDRIGSMEIPSINCAYNSCRDKSFTDSELI